MCYGCQSRAYTAQKAVDRFTSAEYIKFRCAILDKDLGELFLAIGFSNNFPVAIGENVYSVNSITFKTTQLVPEDEIRFVGNLVFKKEGSDKLTDFSKIFSLVQEER